MLLFLAVAAAPALAQRDAVIAGKVVDTTGAPIAGATVEIVSLDRGDTKTLRTNDDGEYLGRGFRPEVYLIRASAEGFVPVEQQMRANLGMNTVDITMAAGSVQPDVDYGALNDLYDRAFSTYNRAAESNAPGDWETARSLVKELLAGIEGLTSPEANTMRESAYEILGRSEMELGNDEASIAAWNTILETKPDSLVANVWAAQVYTRAQNFEAALPYLKRAAELAPDDAGIQYNAGAVMLQQGEVEPGIAAMERALELRPEGFTIAMKNLGYAYLRVQRYEDAVAMLKAYLEAAPEAPDRAEVEQMIAALEAQLQQ
jgi:tetratricopeptide (TPR) repeat protein